MSTTAGYPALYCDRAAADGHVRLGLQSCRDEGLVGSGCLQRVLSGCEPASSWFDRECVELCGHVFVTCTAVARGNHTALLLFQQRLHELVNGAESGLGKDSLQGVFLQCVEFLHFLECYVHRYSNRKDFKTIAMEIVTCLPLLCDVLDPFDDQLSMLSNDRHGNQTAANLTIHLALQLRFMALSILHRLVSTSAGRLEPQLLPPQRAELSALVTSSLAGLVDSVAQELLRQALRTFRNAGRSSVGGSVRGRGRGVFPCQCVQELWLAVLHIGSSGGRGFWGHVTSILQEKLDKCTDSEAVQFVWWAVPQLAELHLFSTTGQLGDIKPSLPGCWETMVSWLPRSLATVEGVAGCVCGCWALTRLWGPSLEAISRLWEHQHRHMNEPGMLVEGSLAGWANSESSTPQRWLQYTLEFGRGCHGYEPPPTHLNRSSYELFLSLLSESLHFGGAGGEGLLAWRRIKGRFYSKIHRRWIHNLSGAGMRRLISLYLVLAESADTLEVGGKMVASLASSSCGLDEPRVGSATLWRGVFALLLLCEVKGCHMTSLVDKLLPSVDALMKATLTGSCDHRLLWDTVGVVLDGIQELVENVQAVELGACKLLDGYLTEMLAKLVGGDLSRVLRLVESLATSLSLHFSSAPAPPPPCCVDGCQQLWVVCGAPVIARAKDASAPVPQLALTAAALTTLCCKWQRSLSDTLLQEFGFAASSRPELAASYLCHVMSDDVLRQELFAASEHTQLRVANAWLRCVLAPPTSAGRRLEELTGLVQKLPFLSSLAEAPLPADPLAYFEHLLRAFNSKHLSAGVGSAQWRGRLQLVLANFLSFAELSLSPSTAAGGGGGALRSSYKAAAAIMRSCPRMVYSKMDSRCLLPLLVDRMVLPLATSKTPPLTQLQSSCIKAHLHHFVSGLLRLDPEADSFIKRKLKQIFSRYFQRYASSQQGQSTLMNTYQPTNPFLLLLQPAFQAPPLSAYARSTFAFTLEVVSSQFLVLPQEPATLLPTLCYLSTVLEGVRCPQLLADCTPLLLGSMLPCLLACDVCAAHSEPRDVRAKVTSILKSLFGIASARPTSPVAIATVKHYVASNVHRSQGTALKPLHVLASLNKPLVEAAMADISEVVEGEGTPAVGVAFTQLQALLRMNYCDDADALL